jgi:hypothetical protein
MADDSQQKVLEELVMIRWLLIFIASMMAVVATLFVVAVL